MKGIVKNGKIKNYNIVSYSTKGIRKTMIGIDPVLLSEIENKHVLYNTIKYQSVTVAKITEIL